MPRERNDNSLDSYSGDRFHHSLTYRNQSPFHSQELESLSPQGLLGLKLKLRQGLDCVGQFHQHLVSQLGDAIGVADGEPFWNAHLEQWQVWVNFIDGCTSVVCDWLVAV